MGRTIRNRHCTPHGWVVRDGGFASSEQWPTKRARNEGYAKMRRERWEAGLPMDNYTGMFDTPKFRRWMKENKSHRIAHYRQYRAKVRNHMAHRRWEAIPPFRRTSGWLTY